MPESPKGESAIRAQVACSQEQLYSQLKTGIDGLSVEEASRRLKECGPNALPEQKKLLVYKKVIEQLKNLFNVLLIIAAVLSFIGGITAHDSTSIQMGFAILAVVVIAIVFSIFQEKRAERAVEAIKELVPKNTKVMREGQVKQVPVTDIVPGDIISLEEGDKIPADARVINCYEFSVDNSPLTGESDPQKLSAQAYPESVKGELVRCSNLVFAGTTVSSGSGTAVVLATGIDTQFGRIVALAGEIEEPPSPLQRELDITAKLNFIVAISIGILFLLIAYFFLHLPLTDSLLFMIGVMVSLTPEGLQVTVTLSLALSSLAMSKRNVIVKRLSSVETLGSCTVICSDKTGTITEGQMTVRLAWTGARMYQVTGEGYEPAGSVIWEGQKITSSDHIDLQKLCEVAALDNTATLVPPLDRKKSRWTAIGDSTDAALLVLAAKAGIQSKQALSQAPRIGMIPFDSVRKMMTSVHKNEKGEVVAYTKGAGFEILSRCTSAYWGENVAPLNDEMRQKIRTQIDAFARQAYRVLALATRSLPEAMPKYESGVVENQLTFIGLVAILDPPRAETPEAVHKARTAGIRVIMITGDHELTAEAIARKVGMITSENYAVMTGYTLAQTSDEQLSKLLDTPELVFARITPEQKLRIVRAFRAKGEIVAVTGDGVNDAPALLEADIGVAMGISGTDVARESADMVLLDDNFASIVNGIEEGRGVFDNLKKFIVYVFSHNWAELMTFLVFILLQTPLPLAVVQVLAIDIIMEIPPSLSLTLDPPEPGTMDRPPRRKGSRLFNLSAMARSAYIGSIIGLYALFWCFFVWSEGGWSLGMPQVSGFTDTAAYLKGTGIVMAGIMAGQLGTLIAVRTSVQSAFSLKFGRNKWLLPAITLELIILMVLIYVPFLGQTFYTAPLEPIYWLCLFSLVPAIILVEEGRKFVVRRYLLPPKVVTAPPVPLPAPAPLIAPAVEFVGEAPFVERAAPVILPMFVGHKDESSIPIALCMGVKSGSRLVVLRFLDDKSKDWMLKRLEIQVEKAIYGRNVPVQYMDIHLPFGERRKDRMIQSLRKAMKDTKAETLVLPVSRDLLVGRRRALKEFKWLEQFAGKRIVLVGEPTLASERHYTMTPRILIPVLDKFHSGSFELAEAISACSAIPDVDIVAAKVIEIPQIVPLYSIYKPESLVNVDEQLSFLDAFKGKALQKLIKPEVLLVRKMGRDLVDFANERKVDLMIMEGDWSAKRHGFLTKVEREIAMKVHCTMVISLPSVNEKKGHEQV
jgi:Ca2+-transporting ATPase